MQPVGLLPCSQAPATGPYLDLTPFISSHPIFVIFILILSSYLRLGLPNGILPLCFSTKIEL